MVLNVQILFASSVKFIPKYFMLLYAFVNVKCFLNFLFRLCITSIYKCNWFLVLILYPMTSLNWFIHFKSFFFLVCGIFRIFHKIMSPANRDYFTPSFSIWILFLSFSDRIALARTSNIMLNWRGDIGHFCLTTGLKEKAFHFSPLSLMLVVKFSYKAFIVLRQFPSISSLLSILSWPPSPHAQSSCLHFSIKPQLALHPKG